MDRAPGFGPGGCGFKSYSADQKGKNMNTYSQEMFYRNNRKVMFIEPPFYRLYHDQYCLVKYPLALGYLSGSVMKNTDWQVQTYNADFNPQQYLLSS